ncbi:unnamed protein product [Protopolystoma xenopodis]|uniref:Uncharacterized protein n=1 Tax=Protopolystoma xenopodis TaxID=117903 RepID=A0A3S5AJP0_9PLAT|nr:unnamed protein product [Protopolystoma xenopodis]
MNSAKRLVAPGMREMSTFLAHGNRASLGGLDVKIGAPAGAGACIGVCSSGAKLGNKSGGERRRMEKNGPNGGRMAPVLMEPNRTQTAQSVREEVYLLGIDGGERKRRKYRPSQVSV